MTGTLVLAACPTCHAPGGEEFAFGDAELRRCPVCGTVYRRDYDDPDAVYVDGYYTGALPYGMDVRHPRFLAFLGEINTQRAALAGTIPGLAEPARALDVGCGTGDFLVALRDRGWAVHGVEPIEESAGMARERGVAVETAMLADSGVERGAWDLVSALHVLEHQPDGPAFLRELAAWARPGGHVLVELPNWGSRLRASTGGGWIHLRPREHLVHHTTTTVATALREAGLEPVQVLTRTWRSALQTPAEKLADAGRGGWTRLPGPAARGLAAATRAMDERRGAAMVLWAVGRVPA